MNNNIAFHILSVIIAGFLVAVSCTGAKTAAPSANSTPVSTPSSQSGTTTSDASQINVPAVDKTKLPVIQFSVAPTSIAPGGSATLTWNVTNATSVTIDHGVGPVSGSGTKKVSPTAPTTYKLIASNDAGASVKLVSLAVTQPGTTTPAAKPSK